MLPAIEKSPHLTTALERAKKQARKLGHPQVTVQHLFCELLDDPEVFSHILVEHVAYPDLSAKALELVLALERDSAPNVQSYPPLAEELETLLRISEDIARTAPRADIDGPLLLALMRQVSDHPVSMLLVRHFSTGGRSGVPDEQPPADEVARKRPFEQPGWSSSQEQAPLEPGSERPEAAMGGPDSAGVSANSGNQTAATVEPITSEAQEQTMESLEREAPQNRGVTPPKRGFWRFLSPAAWFAALAGGSRST